MTLANLKPRFLKFIDDSHYQETNSITDADGIMFLCPRCFIDNNGEIGTHIAICWRPRVPPSAYPGPDRWEFEGTGYDDLTLRAGSSSVLLMGGCNAHFFITNGKVVMV